MVKKTTTSVISIRIVLNSNTLFLISTEYSIHFISTYNKTILTSMVSISDGCLFLSEEPYVCLRPYEVKKDPYPLLWDLGLHGKQLIN